MEDDSSMVLKRAFESASEDVSRAMAGRELIFSIEWSGRFDETLEQAETVRQEMKNRFSLQNELEWNI